MSIEETIDGKVLVIEVRIPLPDDYMEGVGIAARAKPSADAFRDGLAEALPDIPHRVTTTVMMPTPPKKTRAPRADKGQPRSARDEENLDHTVQRIA